MMLCREYGKGGGGGGVKGLGPVCTPRALGLRAKPFLGMVSLGQSSVRPAWWTLFPLMGFLTGVVP